MIPIPPKLYMLAGVAIIIAGLSVYAYTLSLQLTACEASYAEFVAKTEALGERARQDALIKDNANERNRRIADEKFTKTNVTNAAVIKQLRDQSDTGTRSLPQAPGTSPRPDLYCADRGEFERGNGESFATLQAEARKIVDRGTAYSLKLQNACAWSKEVR